MNSEIPAPWPVMVGRSPGVCSKEAVLAGGPEAQAAGLEEGSGCSRAATGADSQARVVAGAGESGQSGRVGPGTWARTQIPWTLHMKSHTLPTDAEK